MSAFELEVLIGGRHAATLTSTSGQLRLRYRDDYRRLREPTPLSTSLPPQVAEHTHQPVSAFLWGLLPDNERVLQRWARTYQVSASNPASLLSSPVGIDCAGAVQFVPADRLDEVLADDGEIDWLTDADVAAKLRELARDGADWLGERVKAGHFSLAGAQAKTALRRDPASGRWGMPHGAEPTSHILKPGVYGFEEQALNEHLCLSAVRRLGLRAALTWVETFEDQQAIVIERFDRTRRDGKLLRVHQEDLCQALGVHPEGKYQHDGGPSPQDVVARLRRVMPAEAARDATARFVDALLLNWLIGGTDAHAKNYGLLLAGGQVRPAPLYDVASMLPYEHDPRQLDLAMKVGGEYRLKAIGPRNWQKLADSLGLDADQVLDRALDLAERLPDALAAAGADPDVAALDSRLPGELTERVADWSARCARALQRERART